ncbi:hypothetical protein D9M68_585490 [compost metagenome]
MHTDFPPPSVELVPLTGNTSTTPVLLLDASCSAIDLQDCADRGLLRSLASLKSLEADGSDLLHFADAAHLLLTDACDLLAAARKAARREVVG